MELKPLQPRDFLINAHIAWSKAKYPSMPEVEIASIAKGKNRKLSTTNGITNAIIDYCKYLGFYANRINTTGRKIKVKSGKEIYIPGTTKRGTPDIDIIASGLPIKVEVKNAATRDKLSNKQEQQGDLIKAAGGIYIIATSFDSFYYQFDKILNPVNAA